MKPGSLLTVARAWLRSFRWTVLLIAVGINVALCVFGAQVLSRHLVLHEATLVSDLVQLLLSRSLPLGAFVPSATFDATAFGNAVGALRESAGVVRVVLYDVQTVVRWSDDSALIGRRLTGNDELHAALAGEIGARIARPKDDHQPGLGGFDRLQEVYLPIRHGKGGPVVAVLEIYRHAPGFFAALDRALAVLWLTGSGVAVFVYVALFTTIRRAVPGRSGARAPDGELPEWPRKLVDVTPDVVFTMSPAGQLTSLNAAFDALTGWSRDEWIGRPFTALVHPDDASAALDLLAAVQSEERSEARSVRVRSITGELRTWDVTVTCAWDGPVRTVLGVARDITERVRMRDAVRYLDATIEAMRTRVAHELHDEAAQLLAGAHIALDDVARGAPPAIRENLRDVTAVLDEIEEHLRRVCYELRPRVLDDAGLVPAIESLAAGAWRRAAIRVRVTGSTGGRLPPLVETVLYRVVQEALTNVIKHARATSVTVRVWRDARAVSCEVRDDGIGFEPGPTAGLGLLGIRERAAALGGSVEITAVPGDGTTLSVTIPIEPDPPA